MLSLCLFRPSRPPASRSHGVCYYRRPPFTLHGGILRPRPNQLPIVVLDIREETQKLGSISPDQRNGRGVEVRELLRGTCL